MKAKTINGAAGDNAVWLYFAVTIPVQRRIRSLASLTPAPQDTRHICCTPSESIDKTKDRNGASPYSTQALPTIPVHLLYVVMQTPPVCRFFPFQAEVNFNSPFLLLNPILT